MTLPSSPACERNKRPIAEVLKNYLVTPQRLDTTPPALLEIGSGTGEHAAYFASCFSAVTWQPSDVATNLPHIARRCAATQLANLRTPIVLDLASPSWLPSNSAQPAMAARYDFIFTANTLHIVSLTLVERLFEGCRRRLKPSGLLFVYGPFNYNGEYTSESNRDFDHWLKARDLHSGIRDIEKLAEFAAATTPYLRLIQDFPMPSNNRLLVFQKDC